MKSIITLVAVIFCSHVFSQSSSGPRSAGTFSNNTSVGSVSWSSTGNALSSNNTYSSASVSLGILSSTNTQYLVASNFGFDLPGSSVVTGIKVEVEKKYNILLGVLSSISDNSVRLVKGGVISGNNNKLSGNWPSSDAYSTYGGAADMWGQTWYPANINASDFGVAISASVFAGLAALTMDALIDHIRITVYFNIPVPVHFINVNAEQFGKEVRLFWSTASEAGSRYFVAERMLAGLDSWEEVDRVPASGESDRVIHYSGVDHFPGETNIYRIREVDLDSKIMYSPSFRLHTRTVIPDRLSLTPNPANGVVTICIPSAIHSIQLADMAGRIIRKTTVPGNSSNTSFRLTGIPAGIYTVSVVSAGRTYMEKLVVNP